MKAGLHWPVEAGVKSKPVKWLKSVNTYMHVEWSDGIETMLIATGLDFKQSSKINNWISFF